MKTQITFNPFNQHFNVVYDTVRQSNYVSLFDKKNNNCLKIEFLRADKKNLIDTLSDLIEKLEEY